MAAHNKAEDLVALGMAPLLATRLEASYDHLKVAAGNVKFSTPGKTLAITNGTNFRLGTITLNGTTPVVTANTTITANTRFFFTGVTTTNAGIICLSSISAGVSYSVVSTNALDTRTCYVLMIEELSGDNTPTTSVTAGSKANDLMCLGMPLLQANRMVRDYDTFAVSTGNLTQSVSGYKIGISGGTNGRIGTATLSGGTITVANTSVTANTKFLCTGVTTTNAGNLRVATVSAGSSFTIDSSSGTDARVVHYMLLENF